MDDFLFPIRFVVAVVLVGWWIWKVKNQQESRESERLPLKAKTIQRRRPRKLTPEFGCNVRLPQPGMVVGGIAKN